jgi:hypothetical protein
VFRGAGVGLGLTGGPKISPEDNLGYLDLISSKMDGFKIFQPSAGLSLKLLKGSSFTTGRQ